MDISEFAFFISKGAHKDQKDKAGKPYFRHILFVVSVMNTKDTKIIAFLHDIVEDTGWTFGLLALYFPSHIVDAVVHLTRREREEYEDYIYRLKENALAVKVKLADLEHNMKIERIKNPTEKDIKRIEKYKKAYEILKGE